MQVGVILRIVKLLLYMVRRVVLDSKEQTVVHQVMLGEEFLILLHDLLYAPPILLCELEEQLLRTLDLDVLIFKHGCRLHAL
jgi:hypothetical protein